MRLDVKTPIPQGGRSDHAGQRPAQTIVHVRGFPDPSRLPLRAASPTLTGPDRWRKSSGASNRLLRWQNGGVSKSTVEQESSAEQADQADSEDVLVARIAADRRAGRDTTHDVKELLSRAGKENRAALDRLAQ